MHSLPIAPQFQFAPTWIGMIVAVAAALALLALVAVVTALLSSGKPIIPLQRLKTFAAMLLLIVPALAVVGLIGYFWTGTGSVAVHREVRTAVKPRAKANIAIRKSEPTTSNLPSPQFVEASIMSPVAEAPDEAEDSSEFECQGPESVVANDPAASGDSVAAFRPVAKLTDVLRVQGTASAPPDWQGKEPVPDSDDSGVLVSLSSQRFATLGEAEGQVTALAVDYVKKFYQKEYPLRDDWTVPVSVIHDNAVNAIVGEVFDKDFGNGVTEKMYRAHLRLNLNQSLRQALHASWNDQLVNHRLWELGGGLALATLVLGTCAGYFRLDDWTDGRYRRRLKLAAGSLLAAGGLVTSVCLLMA
jgi:hypothetical protein